MKLTAITCTTPERAEAFELCKTFLSRQTRQPDQWLVLDGPLPMQQKLAQAIETGAITGEGILFIEDDDYFHPSWIEWCEDLLVRGYDIVGEGLALYYSPVHRWWSNCGNVRHASLCQTAIRRSLLPHTWNIISDFNCPWIDVQLWNIECNRFLKLPKDNEHLVIGIKGLCGGKGYSREHRQVNYDGNEPDLELEKLRSLIGADADLYARFYDSSSQDELLRLAGAFQE
jgi:hypothetical protein